MLDVRFDEVQLKYARMYGWLSSSLDEYGKLTFFLATAPFSLILGFSVFPKRLIVRRSLGRANHKNSISSGLWDPSILYDSVASHLPSKCLASNFG